MLSSKLGQMLEVKLDMPPDEPYPQNHRECVSNSRMHFSNSKLKFSNFYDFWIYF